MQQETKYLQHNYRKKLVFGTDRTHKINKQACTDLLGTGLLVLRDILYPVQFTSSLLRNRMTKGDIVHVELALAPQRR